jgi:hypothetical protein
MRQEDRTALIGIVIGLAWGGLTMAGPLAFPDAPIWVWQVSFLLAGTIVVGGVIILIYDLTVRPKLKGQPGLDPFLLTAATALVVAIVALGIYMARGPQGGGGHPPGQTSAAAPPFPTAPPNPEFELVFGPYQPEEVRTMILTLGEIRNIVDQNFAPIVDAIKQTTGGWLEQYTRDGPQKYSERLSAVLNGIYKGRMILDNYLTVNRRYQNELRPTFTDNVDAIGQLVYAIQSFTEDADALANLQTENTSKILVKDIQRIINLISLYEGWVQKSMQRMDTKLRRLRDYKT